jgi:hypothetical protein
MRFQDPTTDEVTSPMRTGQRRFRARRGTTAIEGAVVYSAAMLMTMGIIVMGLGTFRYQQLAALARVGARWASVHGPTYQSEQKAAAPTSQDLMTYYSTNNSMVALTPSALTCSLTMPTSTTSTTGVVTVSAGTSLVTPTSNATLTYPGTVSVTLSYDWIPEGWFSPVTLTSTSTLPITY